MGTRIRRLCRQNRSVGLVIATALFCVTIDAQQPPPFRIEANYIRVDVYATRDGVPVADLTTNDFEVRDNNELQRIEGFSRVTFAANQRAAPSPSSAPAPAPASQPSSSPGRVFVLFLDRPHVDRAAAVHVREPLRAALARLLDPDDLIAVMTPDMAAGDITFVKGTTDLDAALSRAWGSRDEVNFTDPVEQRFASCYPGLPKTAGSAAPDQGIAQEMILRRREQRTLDALDELVTFLRGVSEERKAVITVSNGWRLFTPNVALARRIDDTIPTGPPITVDPRSGRLGTSIPSGQSGARPCEAERVALAALDEPPRFQELLDKANRANVSFYPIDPRGLAVFDEDIAPAAGVGVGFNANPMIPLDQDLARLDARHGSLRTLADATDGIAVVDNSNLNAGLARVTSDFSAYYLLGYHTTGRLDGKFHKISVRVKRPGVQVRARRGYLALAEDPRTIPQGTASGLTSVSANASIPITSALAALVPFTSDAALRLRTAVAPLPGGAVAVSVVADGGPTFAVRSDSSEGEADAQLMDKTGVTVARGHAPFAANALGVRIVLAAAALPAGDYDLRVRTARAGNSVTALESVRLAVPAEHAAIGTILYRRGVTTGNKEVATADVRFRRTERLRVDAPAPAAEPSAARLLDRTGKPVAIPLSSSTYVDADGSRWMTTQFPLAPLAPGDYVVEFSGDAEHKEPVLAAFRVVP